MPDLPAPLDAARRRRATRGLRDRLPPSRAFDAWLAETGEQAPDFAALAARPQLWSPVEGLTGPAAWPRRREDILDRWRHWLLGALPGPPADLDVARSPGGRLVLRTGGAAIRAQLLLPAAAAEPQPLLLVQSTHRAWARAALARGWAACVVSAADGDDDSAALDFGGSRLARRAWALSRAVDALVALPEVDGSRIVVAGHSRNGKAALIAAAFDERIAAAVSSSSGVLGAIPARLCTDRHGGEGIELLTRHYPDWFHPRLRFFSGREHLLPTDAHELLACVAPRPVLVSVGVHDQVESTWAAERAVAAAGEAYALLGAPVALRLEWRDGEHRATPAAVDRYLGWAEAALEGRHAQPAPPRHDPARVAWPEGAPRRSGVSREAIRSWLGAPRRTAPPVEWVGGAPRDGRPAVVWLGALCRAAGWRLGYEQAVPLPELLAQAGFAVACHDLAGSGTRQADEGDLRAMVADARAVLDATGPAWLAGYAAGALVGAHLAATDDRVLGAALVGPLTGDALVDPAAPPPQHTLEDLLAAIAPRPALLATPLIGAVQERGRTPFLHEHLVLDDHHRLSAETRFVVRAWLASAARAPRAAPAAAA